MQCQQVREHLSAYLDRELASALSAAVRAHLESCAECRALADDLRATADLLGRMSVQSAPKHLAEDIQREIERRTILPKGGAEPQPQERSLPIARIRLWPRALAVAAAVVLAAGIGIFGYLGWTPREAPKADLGRAAKMEVAKAPAPAAVPSMGGEIGGAGHGTALRDRGFTLGAEKKYEVARAPAATPRPAEKAASGETMREAPASVAAGKAAGPMKAAAPSLSFDSGAALDYVQDRGAKAAAPVVTGPEAVQEAMNQVANGEARVDQLQAVANSDNLRRADNQLVVRARTVDEANGELFRLFEANRWRPVTLAADVRQRGMGDTSTKSFDKVADQRTTDLQAAPGIYYLASRGAETTWVIVTDRDSLSRFGGQLAQSSGITVDTGSSGDLGRAVSQLQSELRQQAADERSRQASQEARRGQTETAAKPAATSQSAALWAAAPNAPAAPPASVPPAASKAGSRQPPSEDASAHPSEAEARPYAEQAAPAPAARRTAAVERAKEAALEKSETARREESPPTAQQAVRASDSQVLLVIHVQAGPPAAAVRAAEVAPAEPAAPHPAAKEAAH